MAAEDRSLLISCVIPYRISRGNIEFCLVTPTHYNCWEFPQAIVESGQCEKTLALQEAEMDAGLQGRLCAAEPLGAFSSARKLESRVVHAYLMEVLTESENWPREENRRRRWCLPEEARLRIRRKPLRHLIDVAIQQLRSAAP